MADSATKQRELATRALEAQRLVTISSALREQDPVLWAEAVWTIRGNVRQPYRTTGFEFMHEVLRQRHPLVTIMSAAGSSKTESFVPYSLYQADRGQRMMYCLENDLKTGLLVQERVNPNFRSSPYLQSRNRGEVDNVHLKKLGNGFCYFVGMGSDTVTRSFHVDEVIFDEFDAMDPMRITDVRKRLASAQEPRVREISNPSMPDVGIHQRYKLGDMRRVHVTSECCMTEHPLDFYTHVDLKTAKLICPDCKGPLKPVRRRWVPTNPKGTHPSYHIHRLLTPVCDLAQLVKDMKSEDWHTVSAATRMDLGLPYQDKDAGLSDTDLKRCEGPDQWTTYAPGGFIAVDPGKLFDVQIFQKAQPGVKPTCTYVGTVSGWGELRALVMESQVAGGVIDYGPEVKAAEDFCRDQQALGRYFIRVAYQLTEQAGVPDWAYDRNDPLLIQASRTAAIDTMAQWIRQGKLIYPKRVTSDSFSRWAMHMKSPNRVVEIDERGRAKTRWHHEETRPDHQFHVTNYAVIYLQAAVAHGGGRVEVVSKGLY